ncbi:MAG: hypothetical protein ACK4IK_08530 [Bacteroidia bacterium]
MPKTYSIGERISVSKKEDSTSIIIYPEKSKINQILLFVWFLLWTAGGLIMLFGRQLGYYSAPKTYVMVWMAFWLYFEYIVGYALLWRSYGFERILLKNKKLYYKKEIIGKGKTKTFEFEFIKDLQLLPINERSFAKVMSDSYWMPGGEKLFFWYQGKQIRFGQQLHDNDAKNLLKLLKNEIAK